MELCVLCGEPEAVILANGDYQPILYLCKYWQTLLISFVVMAVQMLI